VIRERGGPAPAGLPGPEALERVGSDWLRVGGALCVTLKVASWPREVSPGWLTPLLKLGVAVDLALHVEPEAPEAAVAHLRRQFTRMRTTQISAEDGGDLPDPRVEASADDAQRMHAAIGRDVTRSAQVGLYLTVWADTPEALQTAAARVRARASSMLLELRPTSFRPKSGWLSTQPLCLDLLGGRRRFDTAPLAATLPMSTGEVRSDPGGSFAGLNLSTGTPVFVDRFALDAHRPNFNKLSVAGSGRGKSFESKHEAISLLLEGVDVLIVDPENEYLRLADALGGTVLRLGVDGARVNPLELAEAGQSSAVTEQALFVGSLVATLTGPLSATGRAQLDTAILATYRAAGISADPATHDRTPPVLADLLGCLESAGAGDLATRLGPWVSGAYRGLFSGQTTVAAEGRLVVYALGDLPEEEEALMAAGILLAAQGIWRAVARGPRRRRVVILDEAWKITGASQAAGVVLQRLVRRLAKGARKYLAGINAVTQDLEEFLETPLGRTVLNNSAIRWLPGQEAQALPLIAKTFGLTEADTRFLTTAARGHGLLVFGRQRVRLGVVATPGEHRLCTSDPEELAVLERQDLGEEVDAALEAFFRVLSAASRHLDADILPEVATGPALILLVAEIEGLVARRSPIGLGISYRVVELTGDRLAGRAAASLELRRRRQVLDPAGAGPARGHTPESWAETATYNLRRLGGTWKVTGIA